VITHENRKLGFILSVRRTIRRAAALGGDARQKAARDLELVRGPGLGNRLAADVKSGAIAARNPSKPRRFSVLFPQSVPTARTKPRKTGLFASAAPLGLGRPAGPDLPVGLAWVSAEFHWRAPPPRGFERGRPRPLSRCALEPPGRF